MYTDINFKTIKALKEAVAAGKQVTYYQPNQMSFNAPPQNGKIYIEGPHYPEPHRWYAVCIAKDGIIISVK